jgi:predicted PurR-regulated permease PerM
MTISLTSVIKKLLVLFLLFTGIYLAKDFLMPFCIGGILATLFLPFCNCMENKKVSKTIAVLICLILLLCIIFTFFFLLGLKISVLLSDFAAIKQKVLETVTIIQDFIFHHLDISINDQYKILKNEQSSYTNILQMMLGSVSAFISTFILVLAYFVFLLLYRNHIKKFLLKITPKAQRPEIEQVIYSAAHISQQYLLGLSKMIVLLWIMYSIGFSIIGLKNAMFFAILCGFLEIIPYLGNITGTILTILMATANGADSELIIGIVFIYGTVQLIQTWIFEPLVLGPQVKINPLFTIIFLVIGELLWGIPGLILAIPLTAILKIVCDHIEQMRPYGFLIGEMNNTKGKISIRERIKTNLIKNKNHKSSTKSELN